MGTRPKRAPALEELPRERVQELIDSGVHEIKIRVQRRNGKGQLASVYGNVQIALKDLFTIDSWLKQRAGGGNYIVTGINIDDPSETVVPTFKVGIEGSPRRPQDLHPPVSAGYAAPMGAAPPGHYPPPPPPPAQHAPPPAGNWYAGLTPAEKGQYVPPQYPPPQMYPPSAHLPPGATMASDQLAIKQAAEVKAKLAKMEAEFKSLSTRYDEETARLRDDVAAERARAQEVAHKAEMEAVKAEMRAMHAQMAIRAEVVQPPPPPSTDYAALITALAPVMSALISSRAQADSQATQAQHNAMQTFMKATIEQSGKESSIEKLLATFLPVVMPVLTQLMEQKSPQAQAALFEAVSSSSLNSMSMIATVLESALAGGSEEQAKWAPVVRELLGGVVGVAESYMQSQGGLPGQRPPQALPPQPMGYVQAAQAHAHAQPQADGGVSLGSPYQTEDDAIEPEVIESVVEGHVPMATRALFAVLPSEFKTPEWQVILERLHMEPLPPVESVVQPLVAHLGHLEDFNMLPERLAAIRTQPRETLEALLEVLPVGRANPEYAYAVLDETLRLMQQDGWFEDPAEEAELVEEPSENGVAEKEESTPVAV